MDEGIDARPAAVASAIDRDALRAAFESFTESSRRLQDRYDELQQRFGELNVELDEKNRLLQTNLREKEAVKNYLARILESVTTGVVVADPEGGIRIHNRAARELTGLSERWFGRLSEVDFLASLTQDDDAADELLAAIAEGGAAVIAVPRPIGEPRRIEIARTPLRDAGGAEAGWIYLLRDVTRQIAMQREAERADRLAAMGEMAVSIVHEVRNPLGSIELFASLLRKDVADDPDKARLADSVVGGVRSLNHIISNLLSFTRNRQPVRRPVAARRLIDESLRSMDHLFRQTAVELVLDVPEDAEVAVDAELVKQVFMNLILNAVQAMEEGGGTLTVTAGEAVDEGRSFVRFRFRDTGRGMTEDVRRRVFNPFFSTKDRGTGLGLALVHNIVRAHGGRVDVDSAPGRGAVLTVLLPKE